jgi:hypothetical protein
MRFLTLFLLAGLLLALHAPSPAVAQDGDPVLYVTQYKINPQRLDSLTTLVAEYDIPWHDFVADHVEGYQRWYFVHDTGTEHNFMIATMYPDWDMVRGDEIPYDDLFVEFAASMGMTMEDAEVLQGVQEKFEWAYEGSEHFDQIWRPITAEDGDAMEEGAEEEGNPEE